MRSRAAIDDILVGHLDGRAGDVVVELGCGTGHTLGAAAAADPGLRLAGVDLDDEALGAAAALLASTGARHALVRADLSHPLPVATASVSRVLCHNVLELLPDPSALVLEVGRVLRPGGRAVLSHTDFDSVAISGGDAELTGRVVRAYAATPDPGAAHCDGQMGRKLPALVAATSLRTRLVDAHVVLRTHLDGLADVRVRSMFATLRDAAAGGRGELSVEALETWREGLVDADREGRFLYAHTTYIVVAERPLPSGG